MTMISLHKDTWRYSYQSGLWVLTNKSKYGYYKMFGRHNNNRHMTQLGE